MANLEAPRCHEASLKAFLRSTSCTSCTSRLAPQMKMASYQSSTSGHNLSTQLTKQLTAPEQHE